MPITLPISPMLLLSLLIVCTMAWAQTAHAFCGFYVAKADTKLFNKASKVVIARHDNKTVITMASDYQGDPKEFAMVIPVPTVLERDQIHVTEPTSVDHLDSYTAPRLVEYFDPNPCRMVRENRVLAKSTTAPDALSPMAPEATALGVTIEAQYTVGEYVILILSAQESSGLETWLRQSGYKIPSGASPIISSYLAKKMKFFVAKINLKAHIKQGTTYLRPLQIAFESDYFMLPIRLGTINANGPQELFIFTLTKTGRVEPTNYQLRHLPSNLNVPLFVKDEFGDFYRAMFDQQVTKDQMQHVYLEYAWDMGWCDPCAADPLSVAELRELGVFWQSEVSSRQSRPLARDVFVTRLHVRYTAETFPDDFLFRETQNRTNFQGRYVLRHPWQDSQSQCRAANQYFSTLSQRFENEAQNLASLTGWDINTIRQKMESNGQEFDQPAAQKLKWYQKLWEK